jgi:hypothetical protein
VTFVAGRCGGSGGSRLARERGGDDVDDTAGSRGLADVVDDRGGGNGGSSEPADVFGRGGAVWAAGAGARGVDADCSLRDRVGESPKTLPSSTPAAIGSRGRREISVTGRLETAVTGRAAIDGRIAGREPGLSSSRSSPLAISRRARCSWVGVRNSADR